MKLIKVTGLHTGKPMWLNAERIEVIEPAENGSLIWMTNQTDMIEVKEQHFTVAKRILEE